MNEDQKLTLLCPQSLCSQYIIKEKAKIHLIETVKKMQEYFQSEHSNQELCNFLSLYESKATAKYQISAVDLLHSEGKLKLVKQEEVKEFDNYFHIQHSLTECPEDILFFSVFSGYATFLLLTKKTDPLDVSVKPYLKPLLIWKRFHWIFFIFIQGLVICFLRFEEAIKNEKLNLVSIELETASNLMIGAGAAMKLAGSYSSNEYQEQIIPTMKPPNIKVEGFSGLMSWDHAYLVRLWKQNKKKFQNLPLFLQPQYEKFLLAYKIMASSHRNVCSKFGGGEVGGSVKHPKENAVLALEKILLSRWHMINPSHKSVPECMEIMNDPSELVQTGFKNHIQLLLKTFNL